MIDPADLDKDGDIDDADLAILMENFTGPGGIDSRGVGDLDGDGDIDDADMGIMFAAWTGPIADEVIDAADINSDLAKHDTVYVPAGAIIHGTLTPSLPVSRLLVSGNGPRPVIETSGHAVYHLCDRIETFQISGFAGHSTVVGNSAGIAVVLPNKARKFARDIVIEDCKMVGFDKNFYIVDQFRTGGPGRIGLLFDSNISDLARSNDNHSIGLRIDGLDEYAAIIGNVFYRTSVSKPNKMSHSVYASGYGAPVAVYNGNVSSNAVANSEQFRAGCLRYEDNIATGCGLGPWITGPASHVEHCVVLDQIGISDDEPRGHGFMVTAGRSTIRDCVAARRHGPMSGIPAYKDMSNPKMDNCYAVGWHKTRLNYQVNGKLYESWGNSTTVDADVPKYTAINRAVNRELGEPVVDTKPFITACLEACQRS